MIDHLRETMTLGGIRMFWDDPTAHQEGEYCYARRDGYPVSEHHTLIISKRHVASYFDLDDQEVIDKGHLYRVWLLLLRMPLRCAPVSRNGRVWLAWQDG